MDKFEAYYRTIPRARGFYVYAIDADGWVYIYDCEPVIAGNVWQVVRGDFVKVEENAELAPDWKDSMRVLI